MNYRKTYHAIDNGIKKRDEVGPAAHTAASKAIGW